MKIKKFLAVFISLFMLVLPVQAEEAAENTVVETTEETVSDTATPVWYDYTFILDGVDYKLPVAVSTMAESGWTVEDADAVLQPSQYIVTRLLNGDKAVTANVINVGIDDMSISDCLVGKVTMDVYSIGDTGMTFAIQNFAIGDAEADLLAAWGTPTRTYDGSSRSSLSYETDSYSGVEVGYDPTTGAILDFAIQNYTAPEGYNDAAYAAEVTVPESVTAYVAPAAQGEKLTDFTFMLEDTVYQMPVPVSVMDANGWKLNGTEYAAKLPAHSTDYGWSLTKGALSLESVCVKNDSSTANTWANGMVTKFRVCQDTPVDVVFSGGISLKSTVDEVMAALEGIEYESDEGETLSYYTVKESDDSYNEIVICIDNEAQRVNYIEITRE